MSYDPAYDKGQFQGQPVGMSPVVSAQPVPAYAIQSQTVAAQPVTQQTGQYGQYGQYPAAATPAHQNAPNIHAFSQRPPPGRWGDSICDWPKNLFPSCYCACCCCYGMWLASQIGQKVGFSTFQCPVWTYVIIWVIGMIITLATGSVVWVVLMPMFFAFFYAIALRMHVANRENITEFGGCFGEFCCGFWCWYCSVAQMARHVYGYTKVLDGDGDPDRPDNYAPVQQV